VPRQSLTWPPKWTEGERGSRQAGVTLADNFSREKVCNARNNLYFAGIGESRVRNDGATNPNGHIPTLSARGAIGRVLEECIRCITRIRFDPRRRDGSDFAAAAVDARMGSRREDSALSGRRTDLLRFPSRGGG